MTILRAINAGIAFALELAMLAAFAYWGYWVGEGVIIRWALAIGLPLVAIVLWSLLFAPRAQNGCRLCRVRFGRWVSFF